ncbi:hypothetical protein RJ640_027095 [Escallonia rubra]|uniref:Uncharacterized protein n=2 Tax=Escallonia rubra TaxID=112253 RepID=A0AA88R4N7_9ASTE|nr:hypothetical protein RJ640_027095 [Escallonia rubra]
MLWVDKYRPKTLDKVAVHEEVAQNLKKLVTEQDCPHLLFYGPPGSGKKTLIMGLLRQMFGPGAEKVMQQSSKQLPIDGDFVFCQVKVENKTWKVDGSRSILVRDNFIRLAQKGDSLAKSQNPPNHEKALPCYIFEFESVTGI